MSFCSFSRHCDVRQGAVIRQSKSFGTLFRHEAGGVAQPGRHRTTLVDEIIQFICAKRIEINNRVVEKAA
ncbi:hypothetical protein WT09_14465 [Burkholderia stagnalis]|nr:hypothetical protein WT09_14465 [Burkholderia stagnalis]